MLQRLLSLLKMNDSLKQYCSKGIPLHEGTKLKPYQDSVGKTTIGIGRNLTDRGISKEECYYLFNNDLNLVYSELMEYDWFKELDDVRQYVLMDMCFNIGITKLLQFSKFIAALEIKNYVMAANQMLNSKWADQVKGRAIELSKIMATGKLPWS